MHSLSLHLSASVSVSVCHTNVHLCVHAFMQISGVYSQHPSPQLPTEQIPLCGSPASGSRWTSGSCVALDALSCREVLLKFRWKLKIVAWFIYNSRFHSFMVGEKVSLKNSSNEM